MVVREQASSVACRILLRFSCRHTRITTSRLVGRWRNAHLHHWRSCPPPTPLLASSANRASYKPDRVHAITSLGETSLSTNHTSISAGKTTCRLSFRLAFPLESLSSCSAVRPWATQHFLGRRHTIDMSGCCTSRSPIGPKIKNAARLSAFNWLWAATSLLLVRPPKLKLRPWHYHNVDTLLH